MRTVNEIIIAVQEQGPATEDELRLALLCLDYTMGIGKHLDWDTAPESLLRMREKDRFDREFRMGKADPEVWLGERWTPGTRQNKSLRRISKAVAEKAIPEGR